jgi:hypothetical protein
MPFKKGNTLRKGIGRGVGALNKLPAEAIPCCANIERKHRRLPGLLPFLNGISYVYPMLKLPTAAQRT